MLIGTSSGGLTKADTAASYDAVFDLLGGNDLLQSFALLRKGGRLVSIAGLPTAETGRRLGKGPLKRALFAVASRRITSAARSRGVQYRYLFMRPDGGQLAELARLVDADQLRPVVDRTFPFEQAKDALAFVEAGRSKGKVVLRMTAD